MASDRAARVAGQVRAKWRKTSGYWGPALGLTEHIARAIRRECKRAVEEAELVAVQALMRESGGDVPESRLILAGRAIAAAIRARARK